MTGAVLLFVLASLTAVVLCGVAEAHRLQMLRRPPVRRARRWPR